MTYEAHKKERAAYYEAHKKERAAYGAVYYEAHKKERAAYRKTHKKEIAATNAACFNLRQSIEAIIIAQIWGDEVPRCRADLTPEILVVPCLGLLQIDHMYGGGGKEGGTQSRMLRVIDGSRELDDLRILCERHNFEYALQRGDTRGGTDPKDWEE